MARTKSGKESLTEPITLNVSPRLRKKIEAAATKARRSLSEFIRILVEDALD